MVRKRDKEKAREYSKKYRALHPNYSKKYYTPEKARIYSKRHRDKYPEKKREYYLNKTYALTAETYSVLYQTQQGKCKICCHVNPDTETLHVDHDHVTGRVRGLLCRKCNTMLGFAEDDTARLLRAVEYLNGKL